MLSSWQRPLALVLTACSTGAGEMGAAASALVAHPRTQVSSRAGAVAGLAAGGPDGAANPLGSSYGWSPFLLQQCLLAMLSAWVPRNCGMLRVPQCLAGLQARNHCSLKNRPETQKASAGPGSSFRLGNSGDFWFPNSSMCFIIIC